VTPAVRPASPRAWPRSARRSGGGPGRARPQPGPERELRDPPPRILALRADDRRSEALAVTYHPRSGPGAFQLVPPLNTVGLPGWALVRTFGLERADQFRSPPPPALDSAAYAASFEEVKAYGSKVSAVRTPDQTAYEVLVGVRGHHLEPDRPAGGRRAAPDAPRGRAPVRAPERDPADGYIAGWDAKQHHDFWRPTTAIDEAAHDGNDRTEPDPAWESAELVPPVQDYPSTHRRARPGRGRGADRRRGRPGRLHAEHDHRRAGREHPDVLELPPGLGRERRLPRPRRPALPVLLRGGRGA